MLPGTTTVPRELQAHPSAALPYPYPEYPHLIICRAQFPTDVVANLISWPNPTGGTTNPDFEMAVSVLHHNYVANVLV